MMRRTAAALVVLLSLVAAPAVARARVTQAAKNNSMVSVPVVTIAPDAPTVEIIRGDKRAREVVRQEH
jgi:hypothetical protein